MLKTLPSKAGNMGSIPGRGTKIPHALQPKIQNIEQRQYCNKFNKNYKNGPHFKKIIFLKKKKSSSEWKDKWLSCIMQFTYSANSALF